jgi:hypothetical protein
LIGLRVTAPKRAVVVYLKRVNFSGCMTFDEDDRFSYPMTSNMRAPVNLEAGQIYEPERQKLNRSRAPTAVSE